MLELEDTNIDGIREWRQLIDVVVSQQPKLERLSFAENSIGIDTMRYAIDMSRKLPVLRELDISRIALRGAAELRTIERGLEGYFDKEAVGVGRRVTVTLGAVDEMVAAMREMRKRLMGKVARVALVLRAKTGQVVL